mmetsp:Transcript_56800/g.151668  ORF Transcript_56800/g.151668 Transcript_56800/m.151668 type:complete len:103 (+) Transcript_56800:1390-1698(+)
MTTSADTFFGPLGNGSSRCKRETACAAGCRTNAWGKMCSTLASRSGERQFSGGAEEVSDVGVTMVVAVQLEHAGHPGWPPMSDAILEHDGYEVVLCRWDRSG